MIGHICSSVFIILHAATIWHTSVESIFCLRALVYSLARCESLELIDPSYYGFMQIEISNIHIPMTWPMEPCAI